uniref:CCHC-type domain-containing protein n=1 Tax=Amphimedon queenslandica TaxID=400682 RepID=A0A1X7SUF3_AMPQE
MIFRHTQALLAEGEQGTSISLRDAEGVFLTVDPELEPQEDQENPADTVGTDTTRSDAGADRDRENSELKEALRVAQAEHEEKIILIEELKQQLEQERVKYKQLWEINCLQLNEFDKALSDKEEELSILQDRLRDTEGMPAAITRTAPVASVSMSKVVSRTTGGEKAISLRKGKSPPIEMFSGEDQEITLDDWLPSLRRAADWNGWTEEETLMQLAGHLKGRARQEWTLMNTDGVEESIETLRNRLDPGSKALAAQDFRHATQEDKEKVSDFICRVEKAFRKAYGRDVMLSETRDALLYAQLQEGLRYELMKAPGVSGALNYQALCVAARNEEKRLAELHRRRQYQPSSQKVPRKHTPVHNSGVHPKPDNSRTTPQDGKKKCWNCGQGGHMSFNCPKPLRESQGGASHTNKTKTRMVGSRPLTDVLDDPLAYLLSDSDSEPSEVQQVRVEDKGSASRRAQVVIGGVPMEGIVDTAADITIMGAELFKKVATVCRLHKRDFKPPDKTPYNYDRKTFRLDGRIEMDILFQDRAMKTTIYIKMDASEPLLLSEGVCRQLGIIKYHPDVKPVCKMGEELPVVPAIRVRLVDSIKLPPKSDKQVMAEVYWEPDGLEGPVLLEADSSLKVNNVLLPDILISDCEAKRGRTRVTLSSTLGFTRILERGEELGTVVPVDVINGANLESEDLESEDRTPVRMIDSDELEMERKEQLRDVLREELKNAPELEQLLEKFHNVFSLSKDDRGETDS